jgi:hypothetical protein
MRRPTSPERPLIYPQLYLVAQGYSADTARLRIGNKSGDAAGVEGPSEEEMIVDDSEKSSW